MARDLDPVAPARRAHGRVPASVAGQLHAFTDRLQRLVDDPQRSLHRDRTDAADALVEGAVEERIRSSIETTTVVTDPISTACVTAPSPLSAKKSMKTKTTTEMKSSTTHSGDGITPTAPWIRSIRAASRSDVWSSHLP